MRTIYLFTLFVLTSFGAIYAVEVEPEPGSLNVGETDTDSYGNGYGANSHPDGVARIVTIPQSSSIGHHVLTYTIYDIDDVGEVQVYINRSLAGDIGTTVNNTEEDRRMYIRESLLNIGDNIVEFRVKNPPEIWGVKEITLDTHTDQPITLTLGQNDNGKYGHLFGSNRHFAQLEAEFSLPNPRDLIFSVNGWDIEFADEVSISINGTQLGFLSVGGDRSFSSRDTFVIPANDLIAGDNTLLFEVNVAGRHWGVTDLELTFESIDITSILYLLLLAE